MGQSKLLDYLPEDRRDKLQTVAIMAYELGDISKCIIYGNGALKIGNLVRAKILNTEAKMALADLITQCRIMCEHLDCSWEETSDLGEERFLYRCQEIKDKLI